jgi:hypothetical protein
MKSLESINYNHARKTPDYLNELTKEEVVDIIDKVREAGQDEKGAFLNIVKTQYGEKTFCMQTDYDNTFQNPTWSQLYLYYVEAEEAIQADWNARKDTPHYLLDKSYIGIYQFSQLEDEDGDSELLKNAPDFATMLRYKNNISTMLNILKEKAEK